LMQMRQTVGSRGEALVDGMGQSISPLAGMKASATTIAY